MRCGGTNDIIASMKEYKRRIFDDILQEELAGAGAVLIEGAISWGLSPRFRGVCPRKASHCRIVNDPVALGDRVAKYVLAVLNGRSPRPPRNNFRFVAP